MATSTMWQPQAMQATSTMASSNSRIRRGKTIDESWLFQLFKKTMQDHIDAAWGWEELLQKEGFTTSLPARNFTILELDQQAIACMHLSSKSDHLFLDMILVEPAYQRRGFGSKLFEIAREHARQAGLPIQLSVLKTNPAVKFHQHIGFAVIDEDDHSYKMRLEPEAA
jgi:N-acetylglutamate synthase-like GNAT family acetyltransferase